MSLSLTQQIVWRRVAAAPEGYETLGGRTYASLERRGLVRSEEIPGRLARRYFLVDYGVACKS